MKTMLSPAKGSKPKNHFPRFFDIGHLFERIIRSWGADNVTRTEPVPGRTAYLPLERMALLTGTLRGTLVLRSSLEFSEWLKTQRGETALGRYNQEEIFEEMVALFCLYLFHDFWNPRSFQIGPIHPFRSIPQDWPEGEPHAACGLLVEGYPVEIRLWMKD